MLRSVLPCFILAAGEGTRQKLNDYRSTHTSFITTEAKFLQQLPRAVAEAGRELRLWSLLCSTLPKNKEKKALQPTAAEVELIR